MTAPVEVTTTYVTTVDHLPEAWAFVMDRLADVGPDPHVEIKPIRIHGWAEVDDQEWPRYFEVTVSGMVTVPLILAAGAQ